MKNTNTAVFFKGFMHSAEQELHRFGLLGLGFAAIYLAFNVNYLFGLLVVSVIALQALSEAWLRVLRFKALKHRQIRE